MRKIILTAAAAAMLCGHAQVNSGASCGFIERAVLMYGDGNFNGCLDQLGRADEMPLSPQQAEQALFYRAMATVHTDKPQALTLLAEFLSRYPASDMRSDARMAVGDCYYGSDYYKALEIYSEVNPQALPPSRREDLAYRMAYCRLQAGDLAEALQGFRSLDSSRRYANASRFYQGYIAYANGEYQLAHKLLSGVDTTTAPGNMADFYLSQIYYLRGDNDKALSTALSLLRRQGIEPKYVAEANRVAGEAEYNLGNAAEAIPYLERYVAMTDEPLPAAMYVLGVSEYDTGDYAKAVEYLTPAAAATDAMGQSANLFIGQALLREADFDGAILAFDKALNMDFDKSVQEAAYYNYAVARLQGGKVPLGSSVATFQEFLDRYPSSRYAPEVQEYIITSYLTDGNYAAALKSINSMKKPSEATLGAKQRVLYALGAKSLASGANADALKYLTEARSLGRYNSQIDRETSLLLGEAYYRSGDLDASAKQLLAYLDAAPATAENRPVALYDLGYTRFAQKRYADAATNFTRMLGLNSGLPATTLADAWNRLGDSKYYQKDFSAATAAYDKAYELNPAAGDYALFQKAVMLGYQRQHSAKIDLLKELQQQFPTSALIPDALLETTESQLQLGNNKQAIATYRELVAKYPNTAQGRQGYLQMALTLLNTGDRAAAVSAYKEVIRRYPTSDEAYQAADELKRISAADGTLDEFVAFLKDVPDAPQIDASEAETLTFAAAEKDYITDGKTAKLKRYVDTYPDGASRAKALSYLMEEAYAAHRHADAYTYASELVERYPDNSLALSALSVKAQIEMAQGKGNAALRTWQQLEDKASSATMLATARLGKLRTAMQVGNNEEAIAAADALLASSAIGSIDRNEAVYSRAMAHYRKGHTAEAQKGWQSIADQTDDEHGAMSAFWYAQSKFDQGRLDDALKAAEALTASDSPHTYWLARGFILQSDIFAAQGNAYKSRQYLEAVRNNYDGDQADDINSLIDERLRAHPTKNVK